MLAKSTWSNCPNGSNKVHLRFFIFKRNGIQSVKLRNDRVQRKSSHMFKCPNKIGLFMFCFTFISLLFCTRLSHAGGFQFMISCHFWLFYILFVFFITLHKTEVVYFFLVWTVFQLPFRNLSKLALQYVSRSLLKSGRLLIIAKHACCFLFDNCHIENVYKSSYFYIAVRFHHDIFSKFKCTVFGLFLSVDWCLIDVIYILLFIQL